MELVPSYKKTGGIKMITNEKKENMINEVVKRLGIKKTKIYPSKTNPIVPDDYNSLKGQIEEK